MKAIAISSLLLGGIAFSAAQNVVPMAPKKGVWSLGFSAQYFKPQNVDARTMLNVFPTFFVTDNVEVGASLAWAHTSGSDTTIFGPLVRYYFMTGGNSQLKPFVGAVFQTAHATGGATQTTWGGEVGAHYFVANNVAVTGTFVWDQNHVTGGANVDAMQLDLGFTIFFAGSK